MTPSEHGYEPATNPTPSVTAPGPDPTSAEERVRARLGELDRLAERPLTEHAPVYEALHDDLQGVLAEIEGA